MKRDKAQVTNRTGAARDTKDGHGSGAGEGGTLGFGHGGERGFNDVEAFIELLVGDHEWHEDANDVVECAGGDGDEAVLVAVARDLLSFSVGGFAWASRPARIVFRAARRGSGAANEFEIAVAARLRSGVGACWLAPGASCGPPSAWRGFHFMLVTIPAMNHYLHQ